MEEATVTQNGVIEGLSRILRELLRTPRFRQTLKLIINELDPENAPLLIRTIRSEDPDLFLNLLSATPTLVNIKIGLLHELAVQIVGFPPGMLVSFVSEQTEGIDAVRAGEMAGLLTNIFLEIDSFQDQHLTEVSRKMRQDAVAGFNKTVDVKKLDLLGQKIKDWAAEVGRAAGQKDSEAAAKVKRITDGIGTFAESNPEFVQNVVGPIATALGKALRQANQKDQGGRADA